MVLSTLAGFGFAGQPWVVLTLGILGLVVGLVNVTDKEVVTFLVAAIAFVVAGTGLSNVLAAFPAIGTQIPAVLDYVVSFVAPAAGVVAVKALFDISRNQ